MSNYTLEENIQSLLILLEDILGEPSVHNESRCQISFDCPVCSEMKGVRYDGKGNLEINYESGVYKCWSCGETDETKGFLFKLIKDFGTKDSIKLFKSLKISFSESDYYKNCKDSIEADDLVLPPEYVPLYGQNNISFFKNAFIYLRNRGITDEQINKYKIGYCLSGFYQYRIVLPSFDSENKLNYYITRAISPSVKKFKYLNAKADKTNIIFNEYLIDWDKPIFLVEGGFDHIPIPNSIPLLGKKLYDKLFSTLYKKANSFIIIVLDPDAWEDAKKIYHKLNGGRLYNKILINNLPDGLDISLYNQLYGNNNLIKFLRTSGRLKD